MRDAMLTASWQAAALAAVVWAITTIGGRWITARWRCALWSLVFLRLVMPALPPSPMSAFNLRPTASTPTIIARPLAPPDGKEVVTFGVIPNSPLPVATDAARATAAPPPWFTVAWLMVAGILVLRLLVAAALLHLKLRRLTPTTDPRLLDQLADTGVGAFETEMVARPALVGILRPRLLLPPGLVDRVSPTELRFIVLHELAHVRRHDILVAAIVALITAVHWFNPFAWLAAARFRAERELACDDAVLAATSPDARPAYGETILRLAELLPSHRAPFGAAGVLSSSRRTLRRRIAAIAAAPQRRVALLGPVLVLAAALIALTGPAHTASPPAEPVTAPAAATTTTTTAPADPRDTFTRVYDVRDLLVYVEDFTYEAGEDGFPASGPGHPTTAAADAAAERRSRDRMRQLMADITGSVDPMSWRDNTGTVGSIRELNGNLVITQTAANHERILQKLQAMRGPRSVQVTLEARFLSGGVDAERALGGRWPRGEGARDGHDLWPRFLGDAEVQQLLVATQHDRDASIITAPRMTFFNGQRAYVMVTRQTAYVAALKPKSGGAEYDADIKLVQSGVLLDARAQVVSDDDGGAKYVTLMLNPRLTTLVDLVPKSVPGTQPGQQLTVQVPHTVVSHLQTTVTVPDGQTALYRVFPVRNPAATQPATSPLESPMLLLLRPTIAKVKEPESKQFPLLSTRVSDPATRPATAPRPSLDSRP